MSKELKLMGTQEFMGITIPIIEGGFGEEKKCILVKDVAKIHSKELKYINKQINTHISRFKDGADIIDILSSPNELRTFAEENDLIGSNRAKNVYILSERGYSKLIKILDDDKSWEVHDELIEHYFNLRKQVKESISESERAILKIVQAKSDVELALAIKSYEDVVTKPLIDEIDRYERFLCNKLSTLTKTELATKLDTKPQTLASLFKKLKIYTPTSQIHNEFLKKFPNIKMIKEVETPYVNQITGETKIKKDWIWTGEGSKVLVDYLIELGKVTFTENHGFKLVTNN